VCRVRVTKVPSHTRTAHVRGLLPRWGLLTWLLGRAPPRPVRLGATAVSVRVRRARLDPFVLVFSSFSRTRRLGTRQQETRVPLTYPPTCKNMRVLEIRTFNVFFFKLEPSKFPRHITSLLFGIIAYPSIHVSCSFF
jgi:hypothetical protein